jgi:hypothetical protein
VKQITPPNTNSKTLFDNIVKWKHLATRNTLNVVRGRIFSEYDNYLSHNLCTKTPIVLTAFERKALLNCYISRTKALISLRNDVLNTTILCPYCNVIPSSQVDHFIPKTRFPEFSILTINLIAICGPCNLVKDENFAANGNRFFLHAYLDRFPADSTCLRARVIWDGNKISFEFSLIQNCPGVSNVLYETLKEHIKRLNLLSLYAEAASEEFNDRDDWSDESDTPATLRRRILRNINKKRMREGPLSWRAALWRAVHDDDKAVNYLCGML